MGFTNERMTKEEMAEFASRAIPNPGNEFLTLKPSKWTINREENVFLVWGLQEREEPHDLHFILGWKDVPLSLKLRKCWIDKDVCKWELIHLRIPEHLIEKKTEILQSLKSALQTYGFNGVPDDPLNTTTRVQCNF